MGQLSQDQRHIGIITAKLGKDELLLQSVVGQEAMGELFQYELELLSESSGVNTADVLGENASVWLTTSGRGMMASRRSFNGMISSFSYLGPHGENDGLFRYRATLSPWVWLLGQDCHERSFQGKSVLEITQAIMDEWQIDSTLFDSSGLNSDQYKPYEQCMQYRESTLEFLTRLWHQEGIYYYFQHTDADPTSAKVGDCVLMLVDDKGRHKPLEDNYAEIPFLIHAAEGDRQGFYTWEMNETIGPAKVAFEDVDHRQAGLKMNKQRDVEITHRHKEIVSQTRLDGVGTLKDTSLQDDYADRLAQVRSEALRAAQVHWSGEGNTRGAAAGYRFTLQHFPGHANLQVLLRRVSVQTKTSAYSLSDPVSGDPDFAFLTAVEGQPNDCQYRLASPAVVQSILSTTDGAGIIGAGAELAIGRHKKPKPPKPPKPPRPAGAKLRVGTVVARKKDSESSIDISENYLVAVKVGDIKYNARILQPMAGKQYGMLYIPRVGQQVLVLLPEAGSSEAVVLGGLYDSDNKPPVSLSGDTPVSNEMILRSFSMGEEGKARTAPPAQGSVEEMKVGDLKKDDHKKYINEISFGDKADHERLGLYSNKEILSQAVEKQVIQAGKKIEINACDEIKLTVGDSVLDMKPHSIELKVGDIPMLSSEVKLTHWKVDCNAPEFSASGWLTAGMQSLTGGVNSELASLSINSPNISLDSSASGVLSALKTVVSALMSSSDSDGILMHLGPADMAGYSFKVMAAMYSVYCIIKSFGGSYFEMCGSEITQAAGFWRPAQPFTGIFNKWPVPMPNGKYHQKTSMAEEREAVKRKDVVLTEDITRTKRESVLLEEKNIVGKRTDRILSEDHVVENRSEAVLTDEKISEETNTTAVSENKEVIEKSTTSVSTEQVSVDDNKDAVVAETKTVTNNQENVIEIHSA